MNITKTVALIMFSLSCLICHSQRGTSIHFGGAYRSSQINFPQTLRVDKQKHPGFIITLQIERGEDSLFSVIHGIEGGLIQQKDLFNALFVQYGFQPGINLFHTVRLELPLKVGYARSYGNKYVFRLEKGEYLKVQSKPKNHALFSIGVGLTVRLKKIIGIPLSILSRYEVSAFAPYQPKNGNPFIPTSSFIHGLSIEL